MPRVMILFAGLLLGVVSARGQSTQPAAAAPAVPAAAMPQPSTPIHSTPAPTSLAPAPLVPVTAAPPSQVTTPAAPAAPAAPAPQSPSSPGAPFSQLPPQLPSPTASPAASPVTHPANKSAEDMLRQMLQPQGQGAQPLKPIPDLPPAVDSTSGLAAVDPNASTQPVVHEGTLRIDRIGRLTPSADGKTFEFTFESDGTMLVEPPMILAPNRKLMQLEDRVQNSYRDLKLRVSGEVFEYRGRNYLLLQRWSVLPDNVQPLQ